MADPNGLRQLIGETNQLIGIFITSIKTVSGHEDPEQTVLRSALCALRL